MTFENRLRWAIFTTSVLSPVDNPDAYLWRTLGARLRQMGQEATFFEPRGNAALRALLQQSGSSALKDFRKHHPDIEYRTLEPRRGADLVEWLTRTLATADVALVQSNASAELVEWLGKLTRPHLHTFFVDTGWNHDVGLSAPDPEILRSYSAVVVGSTRLTARYETATSDAPAIRSFGPLPELDRAKALGAPDSSLLTDAVDRLIEIVREVLARPSVPESGPIGPNGHHP